VRGLWEDWKAPDGDGADADIWRDILLAIAQVRAEQKAVLTDDDASAEAL
jgi:hypothetical protein